MIKCRLCGDEFESIEGLTPVEEDYSRSICFSKNQQFVCNVCMEKVDEVLNRRLNVVFDFDNTLAKTDEAMISWYNDTYGENLVVDDIVTYNYANVMTKASAEEIFSQFGKSSFWDRLELKDDVIEVLSEMAGDDRINVSIFSYGNLDNIAMKANYIKAMLPMVDDVVLATGRTIRKNDFKGYSIWLDDHPDNLQHEDDSVMEVLMADANVRDYNADWEGLEASSIKEFRDIVYRFLEFKPE